MTILVCRIACSTELLLGMWNNSDNFVMTQAGSEGVSREWREDKQSLGWFNAPKKLAAISAQGFNPELYTQSNRRGKRSQARRPVLIV